MSDKGEFITNDRIGFQKSNKALGLIYREWYELISKFLSKIDGINIELGCGASFIDQINKSIKKTDVFFNSNTDFKLNAMDIGKNFENKISNLILVNVFHHISDPELFLKSAEKSLLSGGRIIMIEPSNNYWSRLVYKFVGHEPFDPGQIEWKFQSNDPLLDSNQALSWIVFERDYEKFKDLFPMFSLIKKNNMMPFSYLLSGGHSFNTRIGKLIKITRRIEKFFLDKYLGMFNLICLEKI
tara:strand:- start:833 stop:1555 length:723 start_codon:yes stop_codon:yes gene_type:complete